MKINEMNDNIDIFPSRDTWGKIYDKYRAQIVARLSSWYCLADREDAVEEAFNKLMNKKSPEAYGGKMPTNAESWREALYWQARSFLSHMKEHSQIHAKYVEKIAKELEDIFTPANHGLFMDSDVYSRALTLALDSFRKDQDISRRNFEIYIGAAINMIPAKILAKKFNITENNVYAIKFRVGKLLAKYGRKYFQAALEKVA